MPVPPGCNRRQLALGAAAAGLALSGGVSARVSAGPLGGLAAGSGFQRGRFGNIHYRFVQPALPSRKPPLIAMHGGPGSALYYASFLPLIGSDRLVIAPDTPGFGLSDRPPGPPSIGDYAGAMGDLIDALGLGRVDLLGNHTSSATALEMVQQRPVRVRRIVLNSALMYTDDERRALAAEAARNAPADLQAVAAKVPDYWPGFRKSRSDVSEEVAWQMFWEANRDPLHAIWGFAASYAYDFAAAFAKVRQPMLILNPQDMLAEVTARARGLQANARVVDLPWAGGTFGVHAAEVTAMLRDFLDG